MKIKPEFMLHQIGEEYIVMHDGSTNVDFSRIINLNRTAAYLWQRFRDADFDTDALTAALTEALRRRPRAGAPRRRSFHPVAATLRHPQLTAP